MRLPVIDDYLKAEGGFNAVPGWMHYTDLVLFDLILHHQLKDLILGDMLEIGTYHGKSAIPMGCGLRDGESLMVCDLFGLFDAGVPEEGLQDYVNLSVDKFLINYAQYHAEPPVLHIGSSATLDLGTNTFRFIHVDGGHAYEAVRQDIGLVTAHVDLRSVIVFDDFRTSHCPGVAAAVWEEAAKGTLYPFALSDVKMYATAAPADHDYWVQACRTFGLPWDSHEIFGREVLRVGVL